MSNKQKRLLLGVLAAGLLAAAAWAYVRNGQAKHRQTDARPSPVRVVTVAIAHAERGEIEERLTLTGALKPKEQVDVAPKVPGRVARIAVNVGDAVRQGAVLAALEDEELNQQVQRAVAAIGVARANLTQRKAELDNATAELKRAESLRSAGLISAQEFAARQTTSAVVAAQLELARAQQQQAEAELRELKVRQSQLTIASPLSGHVATRYVDAGAMVSPTTPVVRIVNLGTMVMAATVPERDVGKLRTGDRASVVVDAYPDHVFTGTVARVAPVLDPATRTATVDVEVPNREQRLKAEMFARVELDLAATREAVLIPREALVYRGQQAGVFVARNDTPVFQAVETGQSSGTSIEVTSNLEPGTRIVGRGAAMIREGDRIAPAQAAQPVPERADGVTR